MPYTCDRQLPLMLMEIPGKFMEIKIRGKDDIRERTDNAREERMVVKSHVVKWRSVELRNVRTNFNCKKKHFRELFFKAYVCLADVSTTCRHHQQFSLILTINIVNSIYYQ